MENIERPSSHNIKHDVDIHLLMERGRKIIMGPVPGSWHAVYWGSDENGDILAHKEKDHWRFIHFDLKKAIHQIQIGELMSKGEIHDLEKDILDRLKRTQ